MKTASTTAVLIMFVISLSGCAKKAKTTPPAQAQAPVLPTSRMVYVPEFPGLPPPPLRDVALVVPPPENPEPVHPRKTNHRKTTVAKAAAPADVTAPTADKGTPAQASTSQTQVASAGASDASPIGQLSTSGEDSNTPGRQNIEHLISETENGLNGIKRALSNDEQTTSAQIKTFLAKARQSLAENDLDGAQTLATKAKVLLDELKK
ncbi:hypothetical protein H7849_09195 [Alloacidobacterium dinghuense]|uniref:Lipoprotein n=1 Tax=Alloacidobacterium dinghuense TaxID=2763107 RepID=A0A7G8BND5_9BACT|nr:hypothetical protein [Alloacidobacterium dinghuense]QNI34055.1 hypothetical protein H7849_09195 [Alloacidobacterium dinghuense]